MSGYRLAAPQGAWIDRAKPLRFRFNEAEVNGYAGDTVASALLASGRVHVARSFKLHRPRGILSCGPEEPSTLLDIGIGGRRTAVTRATDIAARDGLEVSTGNAWPSLRLDVAAVFDGLGRLLPAGFYYKTFKWPHWHWFEPLIRRMAGLGHAGLDADPDCYDERTEAPEVLVIGGGVAGLQAAACAAEAGRQVTLIEGDPCLGGWLASEDCNGLLESLLTRITTAGVRVLTNTTALGLYDHQLLVAVQAFDDAGRTGPVRERLWKFRARQVILATGAFERPMLFPDNDRPGVMLAGAVQRYASRYGVACGRRVVISAACDGAYAVARALVDAGMDVAAIIDRREDRVIRAQAPQGVARLCGSAIVAVHGRKAISAVRVGGAASCNLDADLVASAGGFTPNLALFAQAGGRLEWKADFSMHLPARLLPGVAVVGACAGLFDLEVVLAHAASVGLQAPGSTQEPIVGQGAGTVPSDTRPDPGWASASAGKVFVDLQNDVAASDVALAARENYRSVEHFKRYTTCGMATDQGKTSNVNGLVLLAAATGREVQQVGTTKFRPPFKPVSLGALVGGRTGLRYRALRPLPAREFHAERGALFEEFSGWERPAAYPRTGETLAAAATREALAVRQTVGLFDGSPLGKIELFGPDAADFLDLMYVGTMSTLPVGGARYGVLLNENGIVTDDGIVARLGPAHFWVNTTSGGAERVASGFEEWLQCEFVRHRVAVVPVTSQWANVTVAGPRAWDLLRQAGFGLDLAPETMSHMTIRCSTWRGIPIRVLRASFSGELGYEINLPPSASTELMEQLWMLGRDLGVMLFGVEALMILRTEKGYLHIGVDTDGTTLPQDVGLARGMSKKSGNFVGRRSLLRPAAKDPDRMQLVGLKPVDGRTLLPVGAHLSKKPPPAVAEGFITSSYFSPTLGSPIALGMFRRGVERVDEETLAWHMGTPTLVRVVSTPFVDPQGERLRV